MGYKLNCGIELTECDPYDSFTYTGHPHRLLYLGGKTYFDISGKRQYMICQDGKEWDISKLTPTEETKRKVAERNQPKCKCGYVIPVMEISGGDDSNSSFIERTFAAYLGIKPKDKPADEPLARIIDWRGGEEVKPLDFVISNEFGVDYRAVVLEVISPTQIRTCRGLIGASHGNLTIIRINTAAIPKQRTMTKEEVEREFGVKISD